MEELAEAAETNVTAIWQAETTGRGLKLLTVVRLAGALRIPLSRVTEGVSWDRAAGVLSLASEDPPPIDSGRALGATIRRHRRGLRLSQEDLAARTGIQRRHLSAIESGRSIPRPITVLALASGLDVDLRQLFAGTYDWYVRPLPPPEFADGQGPPSKAERQEILLRLWGEGAGTRTIAEALDTTPSNVGGTINELRAIGVDVPYRHRPTSADQLGRRLRRRRKGGGRTSCGPGRADAILAGSAEETGRCPATSRESVAV